MPDNLGSWLGASVSTVISSLKDIFFTHAMYCLNTGNNVRDHEMYADTLKGKQAAIEGEIEAGIPNGFIKTSEADLWLNRTKKAISEVEKNRERYDKRSKILSCSLNCWANYKIGKRAAKEKAEVEACAASTPNNATVKGPPPFVIDIPIQSSQLPSQESIRLNACQCIKNDQDGMIGIWGPDRVGNTLLLKKINNSFFGDSSYFVIFVTASGKCSVQHIQSQIIQRLEIRKDNDVATPATNISIQLRTRNFLLLVDDLYEKLDLPAVGIPYPLGTVGGFNRKVVIMSRLKTVCDQMDVNTYIEVPGLGEADALKLFAQNVGQEDIDSDPHIGCLVKDFVKELKGVPSDLIHYGKQMVGNRDPREWEDVIQAVRKLNLQKKDPTLAGRTLKNLEDTTSNLLARSTDVRRRIEVEERLGMKSTNEVNKWLEKVDAISCDVQIIYEGNRLNKDVTMEAIEKLLEVQECFRACPDSNNIALKSVPIPAQVTPGPSMSAKNRNLQRALQFIEYDPVGMIGILGPGGVGKTYLLNTINNSIAVAGGMSFNVIFVTASRGCSVEKIQVDFLEKLGMGTDGNVDSRRQKIFNFLQNRSFLVLLDDLWERIDLRAVGVPYPLGAVNQLKRKVVLTTRLREVCGEMEVRKELKVDCLQEDEAWQLFQEKVGQETLSSSPRIEALAKELANELKGLPLALEVIGWAMYGKDDPSRWESAISHMQLSRCENDDRKPITKIFKQLKFSYDSLQNNTLRDCFLTCALWPEDQKISKVDLAQCWMGLGLVDEGDIQRSYTKAYSLIGDLRDASLIQSWGNWYGYVKVHDVIRDMALWIACGCGEDNDKWFVRSRVGKHELLSIPWSKAEYISVMWNRTRQFPPSDFNPCLVKLRMLRLRSYGLDRSIDHSLKSFTSLTYLDLSWNHMKNIPDELCSLVNLEHLDLSHNNLAKQVPHCFRNLIKLKFLYLMDSGIRTIPEGVILNLTTLQVIDLRTCEIFGGAGPSDFNGTVCGELGSLADLKAASIGANGFAECKSLSGAANLPVRSLRLERLMGRPAFCLSDISSLGFVQGTLYELVIQRGDMEQIIVRHELSGKNNDFPNLNKITLSLLANLKDIRWTGISQAAAVFPKLSFLHVHNCIKLEDLSWVIYLPCLEQLQITFCTSMKQAFLKPIPHGTFPCLKHLRLSYNRKLVTICDPEVTFPSLENLVIYDCPQLRRLPFEMHSLPLKLQELRFDEIEYWEKLEWEEGVKSFLQPTLIIGRESYMS